MGMTPEEWEAWQDEQERQTENAVALQEFDRLCKKNRQAAFDALQTLESDKTWTPSRADIDKGILTYFDFAMDAMRRAVDEAGSR